MINQLGVQKEHARRKVSLKIKECFLEDDGDK